MLKSNKVKDLIGVLLVVVTGLLYLTGVTHAAVSCNCDSPSESSSAEAVVDAPLNVGLSLRI